VCMCCVCECVRACVRVSVLTHTGFRVYVYTQRWVYLSLLYEPSFSPPPPAVLRLDLTVCVHANTQTHKHTHTHTHTHTNTQTHKQAPASTTHSPRTHQRTSRLSSYRDVESTALLRCSEGDKGSIRRFLFRWQRPAEVRRVRA
jgi:hypothetical protein